MEMLREPFVTLGNEDSPTAAAFMHGSPELDHSSFDPAAGEG
jgi:hypothetical protein